MFLLDTNVVSELRKSHTRIDANVARWAKSVDPELLYVSAITILELEIGILQIQRRDAAQAESLRRWMEEQVLGVFRNRIVPFDWEAALRCAEMHVPDPLPNRDSIIAATALVRELTVVTRNLRDFERTGAKLLNPWDERGSDG
jgi:predicted nucleic acid-binding protein